MTGASELILPETYIDMNQVELEYEAGNGWNTFCNILLVTALVSSIFLGSVMNYYAVSAVGQFFFRAGVYGQMAGGGIGAYNTGKIGFGSMSMQTKPEKISDYCKYDSTLGDGSGL